jgi:hypothetical protein
MASTEEEAAIVPWHHAGEKAVVAKYGATEQFKLAWKIISPIPEHYSECEYEIVYAILVVRFAKMGTPGRPAEEKKDFLTRAKKLRAAEAAVYFSASLIDDLKREREALERMASSYHVGKGKPSRSKPKQMAVGHARELLKFGNKQPSLYRDGSWHELAKILFNEDDVDLFDYLERYDPSDTAVYAPGPASDGTFVKAEKWSLFQLARWVETGQW